MSNIQKFDAQTVQMFGTFARSLAISGLFPANSRSVEELTAQAFVKIMAGHELGIGPVAAMQHIHVIDGKTSLDASMVAGLIKRSGKYDYRVQRLDNEACVIQFYENTGEGRIQIGVASWTEKDARAAGLFDKKGSNWNRYRRDMLFSRCITFGARRYCADVFLGPIYTPEELGADHEPAQAEEAPQQAATLPTSGDGHTEPAQLPEATPYTWEDKVQMVCAKMDAAAEKGPEELERVLEAMDAKTAEWPEEHRLATSKHARGVWLRYGASEPEPAGPDVGDGDNT